MKRLKYSYLFIAGGLLILWSCGGNSVVVDPPGGCNTTADCAAQDQICLEGQCVTAGGCTSDEQCPEGFSCQPDGTCETKVECEQDGDCCPAAVASCKQVCENNSCVGVECQNDDKQSCYVGCHKGFKACLSGAWANCDAAPVLAEEVCNDQVDNNCDGKVDENCPVCQSGAVQNCSTACGDGTQSCQPDGQWSACSAPTDCLCDPGTNTSQPCALCGNMQGECGADGIWNFGLCVGQGACEAGQDEPAPCGKCGKQLRVCGDNCIWGNWSQCSGEGSCTPGELGEAACGNCGAKTRSCNGDCTWGAYSSCQEGAGCSPGQQNETPCGKCGTKVSVCGSQCQWGPTGLCTGEGMCAAGAKETQACGNCGTQTRICSSGCSWGSWSSCKNSGPCSLGQQDEAPCGPNSSAGICEFGTKVRTCNTGCQWNAWGNCLGAVYSQSEICGDGLDQDCNGSDMTLPDEYEPNDSCADCKWLGKDPNVTLYPTMDNVNDKNDFYCFKGEDNTSLLPETIIVEVKDQPFGMDVDIHLYKGLSNCNGGVSGAIKKSVTFGGDDEKIVWQESFASTETDTFYVQVISYEQEYCYKPYTLKINGMN